MFRPQSGQHETVAGLRTELTDAMESGAAIDRDGPSLEATCSVIAELKQRLDRLRLTDSSRIFNTELTAAWELEFMVEVAEAVAHSALARIESRGAHQRSDFPRRDDQRFLKHSLAYRTEQTPRIEYQDVTITKWHPEERKYGSS
jgi:fumarate reductase flavoprotein subunit